MTGFMTGVKMQENEALSGERGGGYGWKKGEGGEGEGRDVETRATSFKLYFKNFLGSTVTVRRSTVTERGRSIWPVSSSFSSTTSSFFYSRFLLMFLLFPFATAVLLSPSSSWSYPSSLFFITFSISFFFLPAQPVSLFTSSSISIFSQNNHEG